MKIVLDTNIVFSALLNTQSTMGEILLTLQDEFEFYAPNLLLAELDRYTFKLQKASKLTPIQLKEASMQIIERINFVSEEVISGTSWQSAYSICNDVDPDDTPFVALAIELSTKLWTGDKKLALGLLNKQLNITISTNELMTLINK